jgi:hypothetical protein
MAGARVSIVDLNPTTAKAVAAELGEPGLAIECDVSQRDQGQRDLPDRLRHPGSRPLSDPETHHKTVITRFQERGMS